MAHDLCLDFGNRRGPKHFCAKIDLHKDFDSVNRNMVLRRLTQLGFPKILVEWIDGCVSDVPFSIILNGKLEGFFNSSNGLRQGCPLSPYLFTIVMDIFSCLLDEKVVDHSFKPIASGNCRISHLLYVDDILVLGVAGTSTAFSLKEVLESFASLTGLVVNYTKSSLCFSFSTDEIDGISHTLNMEPGTFPLKYLGLPLTVGPQKVIHFSALLDKLYNWLAGWKSKWLSYGGRFQLIRSSINNYLTYWLRAMTIPKCVLKRISSLIAKFFYHGESVKKLHPISWYKTMLPKDKGGTGLVSATTLNILCKIKVVWRLLKKPSLLADWYKYKYGSI